MANLTDEEYDALDEYYTKNPPKVDPAKRGTGFFTRRKAAMTTQSALSVTLDSLSADWLLTKAIAAHKTPADIISDMVQREIVAAQ